MCWRFIWVIFSIAQQHRWSCTSLWRVLEDIKNWILPRNRPLLLIQILLTPSRQPHNSLSNYRATRSWFQSMCSNVLKSVSLSVSPAVNFRAVKVLPLGSDSGSSVSWRAHSFRISTGWTTVSCSANWRHLQNRGAFFSNFNKVNNRKMFSELKTPSKSGRFPFEFQQDEKS